MKRPKLLKYCVYILKCKDKTFYCGITNDLAKRLAMHNAGKGSVYVRSRGGGKIVYTEACKNLSAALRREIEIKKMTRTKKIALISLRAK